MSNILSHVNYDGKVLDIKDSAVAPYIVSATKNSDITAELQTALNNGSVELLGGPYKISSPIIIPYGSSLNGNGTSLLCNSGITDFAITLGGGANKWNTSYHITSLQNISIDCNRTCSGVNNAQSGAYVINVRVHNVKSTGTGIAIYSGNTEHKSGDCNIINCAVLNNLDKAETCECGIDICSLDNTVTNFRSLGTLTGVHVRNNAGGTYLTQCHPLACDSALSKWKGSKAFQIEATVTMTCCYNDNFNYGIYTNGQEILGSDFFSNYYDLNSKEQRYVYYGTTDEFKLCLKNIRPTANAITVYGANLNPTKPLASQYSVTSDPGNDNLTINDMGYDIYAHGGQYFVFLPDGKGPVVAIAPKTAYNAVTSPITIFSAQFAISNLILKQYDEGIAGVSNWGTLIPFSNEVSNISVSVTLHCSTDGVSWLSIDSFNNVTYAATYNVICRSGILYLPTYIKASDFGTNTDSTKTHTYTV